MSEAAQDGGLLVEAEERRLNGFSNGVNNGVGKDGDALACLIASLAATSSPSNGSDATNSTNTSAWSPTHHQVSTHTHLPHAHPRNLTRVHSLLVHFSSETNSCVLL